MSKRHWKLAAFVAAVIVVAFWVIGTSEAFKNCVHERKNAKPYSALHESPSIIRRAVIRLDLDRVCAGDFTDKNQGSITALATAVVAVFTFTLWRSTSGMLKSAMEQSAATERAIVESAKAAKAMGSVAESMEINVGALKETVATNKEIAARQKILGELQLRAYVSVVIGDAIYQDRAEGLRFEGRPLLVNNGHTPADKVVHTSRSAILPVPLPSDFVFPDPPAATSDENMIGPHQTRILSGVVEDYCDDVEVGNIKRGTGKALYTWGTVTYEDAFKVKHRTNFCQILTWLPNGRILGYYVPNRNDAT
jgi:hypothetical protein